jgi:hypothetical protein
MYMSCSSYQSKTALIRETLEGALKRSGFEIWALTGHRHLLPAKEPHFSLDFPLISGILSFVDYCVSGAGLAPAFSFSGHPFAACNSKATKITPFRINHLQIANL